jgi:hypothetical protein
MKVHLRSNAALVLALAGTVCFGVGSTFAEPVRVRYTEGLVHGFLVLRDSTTRKVIADGDLIQVTRGNRVTSRLVFRFRDGSLQEETAVFLQRGVFRLVRDHLVQKGPAFPRPLEMLIEPSKKQVLVRYTNDKGEEKVDTETLDDVSDVSNGLLLTLLKNVTPATLPVSLSYVAATPKPRVVKLKIRLAGFEDFTTGGTRRQARHYVVKVDIGGLTGVFAKLTSKEPPDSHVWILGGEAPAFVESLQPFYVDGPRWTIQLVSPTGLRAP